jgi:tetratricopeptide (TPR) repeat protein
MPQKPKKSNHFFHELKRRNVYRVMAMYAGAAFVIIEVTNNVVDPLRLPTWLPTVIILLLIVGFPVTAILSWIFDLTPEGMKKTEPLDVSGESQEADELVRRRLRPSDVVIVILLIAVGILIYPKIFNQDDLKEVRDSNGKVPLAVMPFENKTGDTLLNAWQGGLQDLLITRLSESEELTVRQYESTNYVLSSRNVNHASLTPKLFKELATQLDIKTLVSGTFLKAGSEMRITAQLIDAETNEIHKTFQVLGSSENDFFSMSDSLSWLIKNYVEIRNIKEKRNSSIIQAERYSGSSEAFKYYMHGVDAMMDFDMVQAIEWLSKAVESDSIFVNARIFLAHAYHMNNMDAMARRIVTETYEQKDGLSYSEELKLEHLYAYFFETPHDEIKYARQMVELDEMNPVYWHMLAAGYYKIDEFEEAISCWETLFDLHAQWGSQWQNPFAYFMLADAYHQMGEEEKEGEILKSGNELFPQNGYILTYRVIWALTQEDTTLTNEIMKDYLSFRHNVTHCPEALISNDIGYIFSAVGRQDEAERQYRLAIEQDPENLQYQFNLAKFLIDEEVNVDEGLEIVEGILEIAPENWDLLSYKGRGLYKKKRYEEALEYLRSGWEKKPIYNHQYYLHLQKAEEAVASIEG